MTPFLDLAIQGSSASSREELIREFYPKLAAVGGDVEFDLVLWSLAQRLKVDTEELLRQIGGQWLRSSGLLDEVPPESEKEAAMEALQKLFASLQGTADIPLPGMSEFSIGLLSQDASQIRVECLGARRCCSLIEGMARTLCEAYGVSLRYLRQPKRANLVRISFSCIAS